MSCVNQTLKKAVTKSKPKTKSLPTKQDSLANPRKKIKITPAPVVEEVEESEREESEREESEAEEPEEAEAEEEKEEVKKKKTKPKPKQKSIDNALETTKEKKTAPRTTPTKDVGHHKKNGPIPKTCNPISCLPTNWSQSYTKSTQPPSPIKMDKNVKTKLLVPKEDPDYKQSLYVKFNSYRFYLIYQPKPIQTSYDSKHENSPQQLQTLLSKLKPYHIGTALRIHPLAKDEKIAQIYKHTSTSKWRIETYPLHFFVTDKQIYFLINSSLQRKIWNAWQYSLSTLQPTHPDYVTTLTNLVKSGGFWQKNNTLYCGVMFAVLSDHLGIQYNPGEYIQHSKFMHYVLQCSGFTDSTTLTTHLPFLRTKLKRKKPIPTKDPEKDSPKRPILTKKNDAPLPPQQVYQDAFQAFQTALLRYEELMNLVFKEQKKEVPTLTKSILQVKLEEEEEKKQKHTQEQLEKLLSPVTTPEGNPFKDTVLDNIPLPILPNVSSDHVEMVSDDDTDQEYADDN